MLRFPVFFFKNRQNNEDKDRYEVNGTQLLEEKKGNGFEEERGEILSFFAQILDFSIIYCVL